MPPTMKNSSSAPGRDDLIKQVRKKIDALGIEYLYLQFVSVTGRIMGKGIPADHWENIANGGFQLVYGATVNLFLNRRGEYLGYGPEVGRARRRPGARNLHAAAVGQARGAHVLHAVPQPRGARKSRRLPDLRLPRQSPAHPRPIREGSHGLRMRHGTEPEMMWLKKDENGKPNGGYSNPYCYHIDQFESLRPVYMRVIEYGRKMGLDMIQGDHEDAPASSSSTSTTTTRCAPRTG